MPNKEDWDDGNVNSGDGWSSIWKFEPNFRWRTLSTTPHSIWTPNCGDSRQMAQEQWDDGNTINGDGCSNTCMIESGYSCAGGTVTTKDTCFILCGDGIPFSSTDKTNWDDGNFDSGDGWSSKCKVETGYYWHHTSQSTPDTCYDIWGDGINVKSSLGYCDDGNKVNGDGCSSNWAEESGFTWGGGSSTHKDVWVEKWGDGKNYGNYECDNGGLDKGCSPTWEYEYCFACAGGSPSSPDIWYKHIISATIGELSTSNSILISFNNTMLNSKITIKDLMVMIIGNYNIDYTWTATYLTSQSLSIDFSIKTVLQGGETLTIKMINSKTFRGPNGG